MLKVEEKEIVPFLNSLLNSRAKKQPLARTTFQSYFCGPACVQNHQLNISCLHLILLFIIKSPVSSDYEFCRVKKIYLKEEKRKKEKKWRRKGEVRWQQLLLFGSEWMNIGKEKKRSSENWVKKTNSVKTKEVWERKIWVGYFAW